MPKSRSKTPNAPKAARRCAATSTDSNGELPDPGLPFSTYRVCVAAGGKHVDKAGIAVPENPEELAAGTILNVYLGSVEAETGACP